MFIPDKNYRSWDGGGDDPPVCDVVLDPLNDPEVGPSGERVWEQGTWNDTAKFHRQEGKTFSNFQIVTAGTEDGVDINQNCNDNTFRGFVVAVGKQGLTLKGGCCNNYLDDWLFTGRGKFVEIETDNWSSRSFARSTGNIFNRIRCLDGRPVRYAGRIGSLPTFTNSDVRHVLWLSLGITIYYWSKYALVKLGIVSA